MDIIKLDLSDVCILSKDEINNQETIAHSFMNENRILYFVNDDELIGILSIGDYNRQVDSYHKVYENCKLRINVNCKFLNDSNEALSKAAEIFQAEGNISEIPVVYNKKLRYVYKKKENEIVEFDYDWSLINKSDLMQACKRFDGIYVYGNNTKTKHFKSFIGDNAGIDFIDSMEHIKKIKQNDLLLFSKEYYPEFLKGICTIMTLDEFYLGALGSYTIEYLREKGISYYFFQSPVYWKLHKEKSRYYAKGLDSLKDNNSDLNTIYLNYEGSKRYLTNQDYKLVKIIRMNNNFLLENGSSETYNVRDHHRIVPGSPQSWERTIYLFGTCIVRGYCVDDKFTIPSLLQERLKNSGIFNIRVINFGGGGLNNFSDMRDFMNILNTDIKENDIVIHIGYNVWDMQTSNIQFENYFELSWLFNRDYKRRCFLDGPAHLTPYANELVTDYIWKQVSRDIKYE